MQTNSFEKNTRSLQTVELSADLVITGGGMSGVCAAIAAAREGIRVILVQDRPVLGGNASSEVRLWILGATSHMGNNNRWAREGGVIGDILVENMYRNREGNPVILDTIIMDKVLSEPNITLLLNTAIYDVRKSSPRMITSITGFNSQNYTLYNIKGTLFCDASGDGMVAWMAGAAFRMGAEDKRIYGEQFAPDPGQYGELLGHSLYFYSKDTGSPVAFVPPSYALQDITEIPRYRSINAGEHGCRFWWLEYGGRKNTIEDTEEIKYELWKVVYGVWNYIKNSGEFSGVENLTLEWVGLIPGKRESRRFEGHYTLTQQDIIGQHSFPDTVAHGGWAIDLHPADGVYSTESGCIQYHSKGTYEIPYRCFISKDIENLFYAGRCISTSHVAHGSSRVMATSALGGQAVGMAAAQCIRRNLLPADLTDPGQMKDLQQALNREGQSLIGVPISPDGNKAARATLEASSTLRLNEIPFNGDWYKLDYPVAQMLPLAAGTAYQLEIEVEAEKETQLNMEVRYSSIHRNHTPDKVAQKNTYHLKPGVQRLLLEINPDTGGQRYTFITFLKNSAVRIKTSTRRYTGILSVYNKFNHAVNNYGCQTAPAGSGIDSFEFWCPERRPQGHNLAMKINPALDVFGVNNIIEGTTRPVKAPNAWTASPDDPSPTLHIRFDAPQEINSITLYFDTDFDHAMESVQMGHPERVSPFCVRSWQICDDSGRVIDACENNYQTINRIQLHTPVLTTGLILKMEHPAGDTAATLFYLRIE